MKTDTCRGNNKALQLKIYLKAETIPMPIAHQ